MPSITFSCQTITPLFLSGADGFTPELRPPSIKGALRFWWRAMHGHLPIKDFKEKEGALFGDTNQRSRIVVRCLADPPNIQNAQRYNNFAGVNYLWYSAFMNNLQYVTDFKFDVILRAKNASDLQNAAYAFWLLANFGALGSRARRGAGNFVVTHIHDSQQLLNGFDFLSIYQNLPDTVNQLEANLQFLQTHFGTTPTTTVTDLNTFSNFELYQVDYRDNEALRALNRLGMSYQQFRDGRVPTNVLAHRDYQAVKDFITNSVTPHTIEKANFGLPIMYRYRSLNGKNALIQGNDYNRSASSLIFRMLKSTDGYFPILLNFNSRLLPANTDLSISSGRRNRNTPIPVNTIKDDFVASIPSIKII